MNKKHKHDISIGKDQWIIFEDLENGQPDAVKIDPLMVNLFPMWKALETQCVSECCGIDAYGLWSEDVLKSTEALNRKELIKMPITLASEIQGIEKNILVSSTLNNYFTKSTFLKVIDHLLCVYKNA